VKSVLAAVLSTAVVFSIGCGGTPSAAKNPHKALVLSWANDGNPTVPVCGVNKANCKANLVVIDLRTGVRTLLPITATSYTTKTYTDTYVVHVIGYDYAGRAIESACCNVVVK
jgi:hypothetical protein